MVPVTEKKTNGFLLLTSFKEREFVYQILQLTSCQSIYVCTIATYHFVRPSSLVVLQHLQLQALKVPKALNYLTNNEERLKQIFFCFILRLPFAENYFLFSIL